MSKVINDDNGVLIGIQVGHEIYDADDVERLVRERDKRNAGGGRTMRQTVAERDAKMLSKPVTYHSNGTVKLPVKYVQLLRECERQHAEIQRLKNELIRFVTEQTQRELIP